jgi:hypothetical protein
MQKDPNVERHPADVIGAAIMVGRIATGEIEDTKPVKLGSESELGEFCSDHQCQSGGFVSINDAIPSASARVAGL